MAEVSAVAITNDDNEVSIQITTDVRTARLLLMIARHVGGNPDGPRGAFAALHGALVTLVEPYSLRVVLPRLHSAISAESHTLYASDSWPVDSAPKLLE